MNQSKIDTTYQSLVDIRVWEYYSFIRVFYVRVLILRKIELELPRVKTPPDLSITLFPSQKNILSELEHTFSMLPYFLSSEDVLFLPMISISIKILLYVPPLFVIIKKNFLCEKLKIRHESCEEE